MGQLNRLVLRCKDLQRETVDPARLAVIWFGQATNTTGSATPPKMAN